jgi:hypothetical protein
MYTDPSGEWIHLVIGAIIGGIMNLAMNANHIDNFWQGLGYFGIGAAAGALSAGIGAGVSSAIAGAGFGAGFIGTSTATVTGFLGSAAVTGDSVSTSSLITGAGNSWMQGNSFGQGLWDGVKSSLINGTIAAVTGGIMGGIDAALDGRNFWTGDYKQYKLQLNQIASVNNDIMFDQYSIPDNATVVNLDSKNVYYKPERGKYGIKNCVEPGKYITKNVDGIATSKYTDQVFKIYGKLGLSPQAIVAEGGDVGLCIGHKLTELALDYKMWRDPNYTYGWMSLQQLDASWEILFNLALLIR